LFSQLRDSVFFRVKHNSEFNKFTIIEGYYSEKLEQPLWVQYVVLCKDGEASRKGLDFFTNDSIHTSNSADYYKNVYDKGHLAPAASFSDKTASWIAPGVIWPRTARAIFGPTPVTLRRRAKSPNSSRDSNPKIAT
jgi:hypothetical protein